MPNDDPANFSRLAAMVFDDEELVKTLAFQSLGGVAERLA